MNILRRWFQDERGQDLTEYALLIAFVVVASAALFYSGHASMETIWTAANNDLSKAGELVTH